MEKAREGKDFYDLDVVYIHWKNGKINVFEDPDRQGLFSVKRVEEMLKGLGLKTATYSGFNGAKWTRTSKGKPVFIAVS